MKAVGEPDAGKPPVRFDEGVLGNARTLLYPKIGDRAPDFHANSS